MTRFESGLDRLEIIDSIPEDESQTALRLYNHLLDNSYNPENDVWDLNYHPVQTAQELFGVLAELALDCSRRQQVPIVHIECHGSKEGLTLSKGDVVKWAELRPHLYRLNRVTRNHLFIVLGACWGFWRKSDGRRRSSTVWNSYQIFSWACRREHKR